MPLSRNTIRCMLVAWLWTVCYGFVLLSSPAAGAKTVNNSSYQPGGHWEYEILTSIRVNEPGRAEKDVGFQMSSDVNVESVWSNPMRPMDRLLKFEVKNPQLYIKSRKAPSPEGFVSHTSRLAEVPNAPFLVHWSLGYVQSVYIPLKEPLSIVNFKKGIASLFQFQLLDLQTNETDSSGYCHVSYSSTGPTSFTKTKKSCKNSEDTLYLIHPDDIFSVKVQSIRESTYHMSRDNNYIESLLTVENHEMAVNIHKDAGSKVDIVQELKFKHMSSITPIIGENIEEVIEEISNKLNTHFTQETLVTEREAKMCQNSECPSFDKLFDKNFMNLKSENYGKVKAATVFIKLLNFAREATKDAILKVLKKKHNKPALTAIYDILGSAQTTEAHEAAMKMLQLNENEHLENAERYLWALSMGSHPKLEIIQDLLKRYNKLTNLGDKMQETLILTIASMTDKYRRGPLNKGKYKIYNSVKETIYTGIENCNKKSCQAYFIRALKNLKSDDTITKLIELAITGLNKSSIIAMKTLKSFSQSSWNKQVISAASKIFFQITKKFDSSCRTLALDILLESNPDDTVIKDLLYYLISNDKAFEVKKYVIQKLNVLAEKDLQFRKQLRNVLQNEPRINNYDTMSQDGISSVLVRQFLHHNLINGSMICSQEMNSGLIKRSVFDIVLENNNRSYEIFSLGLFSGGLSNLLSSDDADEGGENEPATAGMEITLLGTQIRPFIFFEGQGELMGHVWSGTASESTTAFQINTLLHDHLEYLRLGPGFIAELCTQTAVSFNLAGEIQISLWSRNSHSVVNQNAGIIMQGLLRIDTSFVQSKVEFTVSTEPKLGLKSDIEFASGVAVCLQLTQSNTMFKHNTYKIERIPGSKHKLRKVKYKKIEVPGRTYNLNNKNNEMCNSLLQYR